MGEAFFTDRELDVMSILWRHGSATVTEVREELADPLAYTSVLSALQTLEEKGYVRHESEGRAYRYYPLVAPEEAGGSAIGRILDKVFHGSAEMLLAQLKEADDVVGRLLAVDALAESDDAEAVAALAGALNGDAFWGVRQEAARSVQVELPLEQTLEALSLRRRRAQIAARRVLYAGA